MRLLSYRSLPFLIPLTIVAVTACSSEPSNGDQQGTPAPASSTTTAPPTSPPNPGESENSKKQPKDPTTEIVFGVDSENWKSEGYNLTSFSIQVKVDGVVAASENLPILSGQPSPLPHETRVVAPQGKTDASVEVVVKAVMNNADVLTRRAVTHFVKGKSLLAYLMLEVRCNNFALLGGSGVSGPTCDKPNETCVGAKCTSDTLVGPLPEYRNDWAINPPSMCGAGTSGTIVLGTGQTTVAPLNDNETVTVECGPQGGHHLWMALSMQDLAQSGTTTTFTAMQPGGAVTIPATAYPYGWSAAANGTCELVALRFQLDISGVKVKDLLGKPLDVTVNAEDKAGRKATATRHLNIAPTRNGGPMCRPMS